MHAAVSLFMTSGGEQVNLGCAGEPAVLTCSVPATNADLVWGITGVEVTRFTVGVDSPGATVDYPSTGVARGRFTLISTSGPEGITSTFTLFDVGTALLQNNTEVYCHGSRANDGSSGLFVRSVGEIPAPGILSLVPLNDSTVLVNLEEPNFGAHCITGYSVEANGIIATSESTELILNRLDICDAMHENVIARAHGVTLVGEPAIISTQSIGGRDLLGPEDFQASYQLLQNDNYDLNVFVNIQTASDIDGLDFQAAVSEDDNLSNCQAYSPLDPSTGYSHQLPRGPALIGRNLTVCISSSSQNCSKIIILTLQVSPVEVTLSTVLGPSSASVTGRVDLTKVQAPHDLLLVTGFADSADNTTMRYKSPTAGVDQDGAFTVNFLGLPPSSDLTYSVELSLQGVVYGSVSDSSLSLKTAASPVSPDNSTVDTSGSPANNSNNSLSVIVALLGVFLGFLLGALFSFLCMLWCLKRVRNKTLHAESDGGDIRGGVEMEPMYEVVPATNSSKVDRRMDVKANEAYGSGKFAEEANVYATAADRPEGGEIGLMTNEAYGPVDGPEMAGNQAYSVGIGLKTNEAYGPVDHEPEVASNQAYGSIEIGLKANEAYGPVQRIRVASNEAYGHVVHT